MIYTTPKDFDLFKKECKKIIDLLGLHEWDYIFYHADIQSDSDCTSFRDGKSIILRLGKQIDKYDKTKIQMIKELAMHEVFHVLIEPLYHHAKNRDFNESSYRQSEHAVIHRLQKVFKELI